jgi:hypothetical protein
MVISNKNKFIFIHNYKAGGQSLKIALSDYALVEPIKNENFIKFIENFQLYSLHNNFLGKLNRKFFNTFHSHDTIEEVKNFKSNEDFEK